MTPIEEVCNLLDECGIHYDASDIGYVTVCLGEVEYSFYERTCKITNKFDGKVFVTTNWLTPEQAVAATFGAQVSTIDMDWVRDLVEWHSDHIEGNGRAFHNGAYERMAEEIAATVGVGTCVDKDSDPNDFKCSACGAHSFIQANDTYTTILDDHLTVLKKFNYCPNCGKRIEEVTE